MVVYSISIVGIHLYYKNSASYCQVFELLLGKAIDLEWLEVGLPLSNSR